MFDGLKDKLREFREDAEEVADERVEEAAEEGEAAPDGESAAAAEPDAEGGTDPDIESGTDPDAGDDDGGAEDAEAAEGEADDGDDGSGGVGRLQRARALATGKVIIEEGDLDEPLWDLEMALLESDVEMSVAEEILDRIRDRLVGETRAQVETTGGLVEEALKEALVEVIRVGQFDFEERIAATEKPVTVVFTGVNGVGKTTTIAKMARYLDERGYSSVLANGDTYRAGANEQIREHAERLGVKLISHDRGGDPAAVIYDAVEYAEANDIDVVLGDTAGRLHTSHDLMEQLAKIDRVVGPDLTLFVDESVAGQDAVERAREFDDAATIDGTILTKADADSQGGAAVSIAHVTGTPVLFLGTGQGYDDLARFDPEALVDDLLGE